MLMDSGNLSQGEVVADYLVSQRVKRIHHFVITHPHPDHLGGFFSLSSRFEIENVYDNGQSSDDEIYSEFRKFMMQSGQTVRALNMNDKIVEGEVSLQILHPDSGNLLSGLNNNSVVIRLKYGSFLALFTGDLLIEGQKLLIKKYGNNLDSDLLKAPHHASNASNWEGFFEIVSPEVSIVTVGPNRYGYPSIETLENLKTHSGKVYRTDRKGTIVIKVFPDKRMDIVTQK